MKRFLVYCFISFSLFSQNGIFEKGNEAYENNNYTQALEYYQQILDNGVESAALYFNMGNSHFKLNHIGEAILYYEKAKKLNPLDKAIKANLDLVNERILDDIKEQDQLFIFDLYNQLKFSFTINQMLWLTFISFTLFFIARWLKKWIFPYLETLFNSISIFAVIFFFFWAALSFARISNLNEQRGVVLSKTSEVYTSPNDENQAFILHEGSQFKIERQLNNRYEITLLDGKTGWIDISNIAVI